MSFSIKEYFAQQGSRFTGEDAKAIGPVLQELVAQGSGKASDLVEAAQSSNSPLRKYLEWDNDKAGHLYRLSQADEIVDSIRVRFATSDAKEYAARAFKVLVVPEMQRKPVQHRTNVVPADVVPADLLPAGASLQHFPLPPQLAEEVSASYEQSVQTAIQELERWRVRWRPFFERYARFEATFMPVLNQIDELKDIATTFPSAEEAGNELLQELQAWQEKAAICQLANAAMREQFGFVVSAIDDAITAHAAFESGDYSALKKSHRVSDWKPSFEKPEQP